MYLVETVFFYLLTSKPIGTCNWRPSVISKADWNFFSLCKWKYLGLTFYRLKSHMKAIDLWDNYDIAAKRIFFLNSDPMMQNILEIDYPLLLDSVLIGL